MVSILMGLKGSGKTKRLVELVREAVKEETGDVVCRAPAAFQHHAAVPAWNQHAGKAATTENS